MPGMLPIPHSKTLKPIQKHWCRSASPNTFSSPHGFQTMETGALETTKNPKNTLPATHFQTCISNSDAILWTLVLDFVRSGTVGKGILQGTVCCSELCRAKVRLFHLKNDQLVSACWRINCQDNLWRFLVPSSTGWCTTKRGTYTEKPVKHAVTCLRPRLQIISELLCFIDRLIEMINPTLWGLSATKRTELWHSQLKSPAPATQPKQHRLSHP